MPGKITIQNDQEHGAYSLVGPNGEEGGFAWWGEPAILELGSEMYMAFIGEDGLADEELGPTVYLITPVDTEAEDVIFEGLPEQEAAEAVETQETEVEEGDEDEEDEEESVEGEGDEDAPPEGDGQ